MDRGYSSGFSGWGGSGGGSSRGSGNYDSYGFKDSGSFGFGSNDRMKRSGASMMTGGTNADAVIAKINQRLDMLTQLEGGMMSRFDPYDSFSRSPPRNPRDLLRSASFGYSSSWGGGGFGGRAGRAGIDGFGSAKQRSPRDSAFSGWGAGPRSPRRGGASGGQGFSRRQDSSSGGGGMGFGIGHSPSGRGKLPSLLGPRMHPEGDFPMRNFGGGPRGNRQRSRKRPMNRQQQQQFQQPQGKSQKKRKQNLGAGEEPESKMNKTDSSGEKQSADEAVEDNQQEGEEQSDTNAEATDAPEAELKVEAGGDAAASSSQSDAKAKMRRRRNFERVAFACSVCKFRSFYDEDMAAHMESKFHRDHFKYLSNQLSKPTTDFLEEYLKNRYRKRQMCVNQKNHSELICEIYKYHDLTREIGMEHFLKKVEAAHCSACDVFIPMMHSQIQKHLKSHDHNYNRKGMMEKSKRAGLSVARSILNHKVIGKKMESFLKGENPFLDNPDEQDPEDSLPMDTAEGDVCLEARSEDKEEEPAAEGVEPAPAEEETDERPEHLGNGAEHDSEAHGEKEELLDEFNMEMGENAAEGVALGEEEQEEVDEVLAVNAEELTSAD